MTSIILQGAQVALAAHEGQLRGDGRPYFTHPARVAGMTLIHPDATPDWGAIAYLHDVLEDTFVSERKLRNWFPRPVVDVVVELTNQYTDKSELRAVRKAKERERLGRISRVGKIIKMLDREDNLRDMPQQSSFRDLYVVESAKLLTVLRDADEEIATRLETIITNLQGII